MLPPPPVAPASRHLGARPAFSCADLGLQTALHPPHCCALSRPALPIRTPPGSFGPTCRPHRYPLPGVPHFLGRMAALRGAAVGPSPEHPSPATSLSRAESVSTQSWAFFGVWGLETRPLPGPLCLLLCSQKRVKYLDSINLQANPLGPHRKAAARRGAHSCLREGAAVCSLLTHDSASPCPARLPGHGTTSSLPVRCPSFCLRSGLARIF